MTKAQVITDFFSKSTCEIAQNLLGKLIIYQDNDQAVGGYIVETEAYLGIEDKASHSYLGKRTPKVEAMYREPGTIYVYTMHTHNMLNVVTEAINNPQAVLIRAIEPAVGMGQMLANRQVAGVALSNGPGKLTKALAITRELNLSHLATSSLELDFLNAKKPNQVSTSARIGIPNKGKWTDEPLRYFVTGNPYVSGIKQREVIEGSNGWLE